MRRHDQEEKDRYEIIVKKVGRDEPIETDIMGDEQTQEILRFIGKLNLRSALGG